MKSIVAAALLLCAHGDEETSLMQGLMQRQHQQKLGTFASRQDNTAKLMETATKMLKSGVTPDMVQFINTTITEINEDVLPLIRDAHDEDQRFIYTLLAHIEDAVNTMVEAAVDTNQLHDSRVASSLEHKECRSVEGIKCAFSRKCEHELEELWVIVKTRESEMRRIHWAIHGEWCEGNSPDHTSLADPFRWTQEEYSEGAETSQSTNAYPLVDHTTDVINFRRFSVDHFGQYIIQKPLVETAWANYNLKLLECAQKDEEWEVQVADCDQKQDIVRDAACMHSTTNRQHRHTFGHAYDSTLNAYNDAALCYGPLCGQLDHPVGAAVDPPGVNSVWRQLEWDRKREWETLHIVTCLLETVYTHVIHAIDTGVPCSDGFDLTEEQVGSEINYCHVVEESLTTFLTLDIPPPPLPPVLPPVVEHPCTSEYVWEEQGYFTDAIQASHIAGLAPGNLANFFTTLSNHGWAGCAAPKACIPCEGENDEVLYGTPNLEYNTPAVGDERNDMSVQCKHHEEYLRPGENNGETFRCLDTWCIPAFARCNGFANCNDGSDEEGCNTWWSTPAVLETSSVQVCRSDAVVVPGSSDDVQFFCSSGECTAIEGRCNGFNNCADGSDEEGCSAGTTGLTVEATTGYTTTIETLSADSTVFHDRDYTFDSLGSFAGVTYIKMSNEDKHTAFSHVQMKLRLPEPMTVYVATIRNLEWLESDGWRLSAEQGPSYSGAHQTKHTEWAAFATNHFHAPHQGNDQWDTQLLTERHYGAIQDAKPSTVWEKTFPAGTVSMRGNNGGDGSYLIFVANPNSAPVPPVLLPPVVDGESSYIGCFVDDQNRDLGAMVAGGRDNALTSTFAQCRAHCSGSTYMALQYGGECFCANSYSTATNYEQRPDSECAMVHSPCSGSSYNCGDSWRNAIYRVGGGDAVSLRYANPAASGDLLCVSMSTASGDRNNAGCDATSCGGRAESDATMQVCNSADDGQSFIHSTTGQLHSSLGNNRCLHVGVSSAHGACEPFTLQPCAAHEARQQFNREIYQGSTIWRNVATNLAIDSDSYRNTVNNWIWACAGSNTAKMFNPEQQTLSAPVLNHVVFDVADPVLTVSAGSLSGAGQPGWNTPANSALEVPSYSSPDNICGISFKCNTAASHLMIGLSSRTVTRWQDIDYGVTCRGAWTNSDHVDIYENGSRSAQGPGGHLANGNPTTDVHAIHVNANGQVEYSLNGSVYYTSSHAVTYPWHVGLDTYTAPSLSEVQYLPC